MPARAAAAARTRTARTRAAGPGAARAARTLGRARARAAGTIVGIRGRVAVVGRKHRCVARMAVGPGRTTLALALALAGRARVGAAAACTRRLLAVRLLRPAAIGVAVAAGAGVHAVGHVPGAERGGVAF